MPRKSFEAGMEAGAKPFEEKFQKQADAFEKVGARLDSRLDEISGVMDVMMDDLSAQERKRVYDLNTVVDISELDDTEKEYLCSILYALANLNTQLTQLQKDYLRSLKSYLKIVNVQSEVSLESIENIDNITTQKAIMQTIMEFLFLEYGNHDYMDDYEDVFDCFSVNRKGVREIQDCIDTMYDTVGLDGIAEHYGSTKKVTIVQNSTLSKAELDLRQTAENAFVHFDIKTAFPLFNLLATQGDGRSCYFLGKIYKNGYQNVVSPNQDQSKRYIEQGVETGDLLCILESASYSEDSQSVYSETFDAILSLAEGGDVVAMYELACLFNCKYEQVLDKSKAEYWYKFAADAGFWAAHLGLGRLYYQNKKYSEAFEQFSVVQSMNCEQANFDLANCYYYGSGVARNIIQAKSLFEEAATAGILGAHKMLGCIAMQEGSKVEKYYFDAREHFTLAVDAGDTASLYDLATANYFSSLPGYSYKDDFYGCPNVLKPFVRITNENHGYRSILQMCLLLAANTDKRAAIELANTWEDRMLNTLLSEDAWKELQHNGFLTFIDNKVRIDGIEITINLSNFEAFEDELQKVARKILRKYANEGDAAAAYYYGVTNMKWYNWWGDETYSKTAHNMLSKAKGSNIRATNIDEVITWRRSFKSKYPPRPQQFVRWDY